mmetsp:Transcript_7700/g.11659  ORF Transcript_7700/g.11659 Transcript_7700/m.11659 type:complete len:593 (+) Transcript_7700:58-1836(+)
MSKASRKRNKMDSIDNKSSSNDDNRKVRKLEKFEDMDLKVIDEKEKEDGVSMIVFKIRDYRQILPHDFICPISLDVMIDPVIDITAEMGQICYDYKALVPWLEKKGTSPMLKAPWRKNCSCRPSKPCSSRSRCKKYLVQRNGYLRKTIHEELCRINQSALEALEEYKSELAQEELGTFNHSYSHLNQVKFGTLDDNDDTMEDTALQIVAAKFRDYKFLRWLSKRTDPKYFFAPYSTNTKPYRATILHQLFPTYRDRSYDFFAAFDLLESVFDMTKDLSETFFDGMIGDRKLPQSLFSSILACIAQHCPGDEKAFGMVQRFAEKKLGLHKLDGCFETCDDILNLVRAAPEALFSLMERGCIKRQIAVRSDFFQGKEVEFLNTRNGFKALTRGIIKILRVKIPSGFITRALIRCVRQEKEVKLQSLFWTNCHELLEKYGFVFNGVDVLLCTLLYRHSHEVGNFLSRITSVYKSSNVSVEDFKVFLSLLEDQYFRGSVPESRKDKCIANLLHAFSTWGVYFSSIRKQVGQNDMQQFYRLVCGFNYYKLLSAFTSTFQYVPRVSSIPVMIACSQANSPESSESNYRSNYRSVVRNI